MLMDKWWDEEKSARGVTTDGNSEGGSAVQPDLCILDLAAGR